MKKIIKLFLKSKRLVLKFLSTSKGEVLVVILILLGAFAVRLYKIDTPVADWHSWRQVDTAAVARIYLDEGIDLLTPRYYDISSIQTGFFNPNGYRFVEFPLYNLFHALGFQLYPKIQFEVWGRLVSIFSSLVTTYAVYFIGKRVSGKWAGIASAFFFAFIPFNIYFSRVILPEPMAAMFGVLSVLFFVLYYDTTKYKYSLLSGLFFSLSILIKPYTIFYALPIAYMAIKKHGLKGIFKNIPLLISLDIALVPFFLWRAWMNVDMHFLGIPHFAWAFNGDGIRFRPAFWRWIFGERLGNLILGGWGLIPFGVGLLNKGKEKVLAIDYFIIGMFLYVTVVATASVRHDYYQTLIIPAVALVLGRGAQAMWNWKETIRARVILLFSIFLMFGIGFFQVKEFYKVNHPEFIEVGKIVDESLPKDAKIIVPDNGNTVFLYYTKRQGWPVLEASIDEIVERGASYYVSVNNDADTNMLKNKFEIFKQGPNYVIIDLTKPKK